MVDFYTDPLSPFLVPRKMTPDVQPALKVGILVSPDFTLTPLALFTDCLRHAADEADFSRQVYCQWKLLSHTEAAITSSCGYKLEPQGLLDDPTGYDYIAIVGGLIHSREQVPREILEYLQLAQSKEVPLLGICTGSFVLAEAGLLHNKRCAVHFSLEQIMQERYPDVLPVSGVPLVHDGDITTSPGGMTAIHLAQELVLRHCGAARATKVQQYLMHSEDQSGFDMAHLTPMEEMALSCSDRKVVQAVALMRQRMYEHMSIAQLAEQLGTTERQLSRSFRKQLDTTPAFFWRDIRLTQAHWMVMNTDRSVAQIAYECGFSDSTHFGKHFKKKYSQTPAHMRKRQALVGGL